MKRVGYAFLIFILVLIMTSMFTRDVISTKKYDLQKDGCCLLKNVFSKQDIDVLRKECKTGNYKRAKEYILKHKTIYQKIYQKISPDYNFQDYILIIQKSAIHTCHRDYNGDLFNHGQQHPSYTIIIFLEEMEKCLGVIPQSHKNEYSYSINVINQVKHVACTKGDVIMFDANLIHVGALNKKDDNLRIQMKVSHKDDVDILDYYEQYYKVLNKPNHLPKPLVKFQRDISCMFPYLSTITQEDTKKNGIEKPQGIITKAFSYLFYGNSDFYNLKNAF